jgi:hypothetical protein
MHGEQVINTNPTMKTRKSLRIPAALALLAISVCAAFAQPPGPKPAGLPLEQRIKEMAATATGQPHNQPLPEWKDPEWTDPDKILPEVKYDQLPLSEVANNLANQFTNQFDILLPRGWGDGLPNVAAHDWSSDTVVSLQLRDVTASEVFNAMNLLFENNHTPLRWELKLNGRRQIALLRVLQDPVTEEGGSKPRLKRVFFVGDLIGDENSGYMNMHELVRTITELIDMAYHGPGLIQFHEKAQLLVVTGTDDQIKFVEETLAALNMKVRMDIHRKQAALNQSKTEEPKSSPVGASK